MMEDAGELTGHPRWLSNALHLVFTRTLWMTLHFLAKQTHLLLRRGRLVERRSISHNHAVGVSC